MSTLGNVDKVYLATTEENFKKHYHDYTTSFRNKRYKNDKYIWEIKEKHQENPSLKWSIVKRVPAYSNIAKKFLLYVHKNYPHPEELLNKRSELVSKYRHAKKYLVNKCKVNN